MKDKNGSSVLHLLFCSLLYPSFPPLSLPTNHSFFLSSPCSCEQRLISRHASPLSLQDCEELVSSLQEKYPAEYKTYDLSSVAVAIVFPMVKTFLQVPVISCPTLSRGKTILRTKLNFLGYHVPCNLAMFDTPAQTHCDT